MTDWHNNENFLKLDSRKQQMIEQLFNSLKGVQLTEAIPILSSWKNNLKHEGIEFTPEENNLLTEMFISELNPEARKQYEMLKPFIKNMANNK